MPDAFSRMEILLGDTGAEKLSRAKIAIFGLGGTGSYVAEALARCGVASLTLVDNERIAVSDINRQLYALRSTVGKSNVEIAKSRIKDIDEGILVHTYETFYNEETAGMFELNNYDYIVDAMNTAEAKLLLIEKAKKCGVPVISCMEMDNRTDSSRLLVGDIAKARVCPLAKRLRTELRKKGIRRLKVLYSWEKPVSVKTGLSGNISFVPGTAGMMIAGTVVNDLLKETGNEKFLTGRRKNKKMKK